MKNEVIVPRSHANYMCIISNMSLISGTYAIQRGHPIVAIGPLGVWINSINYWRNPSYGIRRNIDISWVAFALIIQTIKLTHSNHYYYYACIMCPSLLFYPIGWVLYMNKYFWLATIAHSMLHVFPNMANIVLYSGL